MKTYYTNATIYRGGRFETGCLAVEHGRVVTAGESCKPKSNVEGLLRPPLESRSDLKS